MESKGSTVDYVVLLAEDRDGNQGKFCECLREQHFFEILEYTQRTGIKVTMQCIPIAYFKLVNVGYFIA